MTATELLAAAQRWQQTGELARAEAAYRQLLTREPANAEIWYLLGSVCHSQGKRDQAVEALRRAVAIKPELAPAQNSLGIALAQSGRTQEAERCFAAAVAAQPDFAHAHNNLGNAFKELGRHDEALASYQQAVAIKPDFAEAYNNLGNLQRELGRLDDAVANCRQALRLKPGMAEAHNNLGNALREQAQHEEAITCYQQAVAVRPGFAEASRNLAAALCDLGRTYSAQRRWAEAADAYCRTLALRPNDAEAHNHLATALRELGRLDDAIASSRRALALNNDFAEAHGGLATALSQLGDLDGALASSREVLRLRPNLASAHLFMGFVLRLLGRRAEALASLDRALHLQPDLADARRNRAMIWLTEGKMPEGWDEYELRWKCPEFPPRPFTQPLWDGSPLDGKTILLLGEQGFGDTLQFIRYARVVSERGGRVVVVCQSPLVSLLSRCEGVQQVLAQGDPLPPFDVHAALLSLPHLFGTTLETIPAAVPYVKSDSQRVERWREQLSAASDFKIGIVWQGNRVHCSDATRSIPLADFAPLADIRGVRLYSLQKNEGHEQRGNVSFGERIIDLAPRLETFDDTAAVIENLDLVICCDTSVAHLAGALARPVWLALPFVADWRWLLDREDTPWYPTMRLFRQHRCGDWNDVFARMASALANREYVASPDAQRPTPNA